MGKPDAERVRKCPKCRLPFGWIYECPECGRCDDCCRCRPAQESAVDILTEVEG